MKTGQSGLSFGDGYKKTFKIKGAYVEKAAIMAHNKEMMDKRSQRHMNEDDNRKRRICREQIVLLSQAGLAEEDIIKK